ncbi:MAG: hypothetical protein CR979_03215, partial [Propionibacterium sp.]
MHSLANQTESGLTETERQILDFEKTWFTSADPKEQVIFEKFQLSPARYYQ